MEFEVKIDDAGFTGTAKLKFPSRAEKLKMLAELQKLGYGKDDLEGENLSEKKIELASKVDEIVTSRLLSIDVKHTESGIEITDVGYLDVYQEGQALVGLIGNILVGGVSMGKQTSTTSDK